MTWISKSIYGSKDFEEKDSTLISFNQCKPNIVDLSGTLYTLSMLILNSRYVEGANNSRVRMIITAEITHVVLFLPLWQHLAHIHSS